MPNGGAASLDVFLLLEKTGDLTTIARIKEIDPVTNDPNYGNNVANLTLKVPTSGDVQVTQTASNYTPTVGSTIILTVNVTNNGPDDATGVTITDTLPAGLKFESTNNHGIGTVSYDPTTRKITWNIGDMTVGSNATLDINVTVTNSGNIMNRVVRNKPTYFDWNYNNSQIIYLAAPICQHELIH